MGVRGGGEEPPRQGLAWSPVLTVGLPRESVLSRARTSWERGLERQVAGD